MKTGVAVLLAGVAALSATACGSDDDGEAASGSAIAAVEVPSGELAADELAAFADEVCTATTEEFGTIGNRGLTNPAIAAEFELTNEIVGERADKLDQAEPAPESAEAYQALLDAENELIEANVAVISAADSDDDAGVSEAFEAQNAPNKERIKQAQALGLEVCGQPAEIEVEETGSEPPEGLAFAEPKNTVDQAAEAFLAAVASGNCAQITAARSEDNAPLDEAGCDGIAQAFGGASVAGTEQYGPVGVAEFAAEGGGYATAFFTTDSDRVLRYGGDTINDAIGLRPASEENDADAAADETVAAIRDDDPEAFNASLSLNTLPADEGGFQVSGSFDAIGEGKEGRAFVADVRADDAGPELLGVNQAFAFYLLEANDASYVLTFDHQPGSRDEYGFGGFFSVPTA